MWTNVLVHSEKFGVDSMVATVSMYGIPYAATLSLATSFIWAKIMLSGWLLARVFPRQMTLNGVTVLLVNPLTAIS